MKFRLYFFLLLAYSCCSGLLPLTLKAQPAAEMSKPWVFWYWMQGGVSRAGITADLQAMKEAGIGGAYLMTIKGAEQAPYQPAVNQLTPAWWEMIRFAMEEAKRLDLKLGMHVSDGFALAGGPWITPELSMQKVVSSKLNVLTGIKKIVLPLPAVNEGYYKDIAVYAYPSPSGAGISTQTVRPKVTTSTGVNAVGLARADNKENFTASEPCWIQYEFDRPFTCRSINIRTSGNNYQAQRLGIEVSNDSKNFKPAAKLEAPRHGWQDTDEDFTYAIKPVSAKFFRFTYNKAGSEPGAEDLDAAKWKPSLKVLNIELSAESQIHQYQGKNGSVWRVSKRTTAEQIAGQQCIPLGKIINLSDKLNQDGSLNWVPPKGNWTILRIGHTSTGHTNATGGGGKGLECDKFNPDAVKLQFESWYDEALKQGGPEIAGKVLNIFHVDSWECGSQNWSANFKTEFKKRRGYDLTPYLPIMTGLPVQSAAISENFLYDIRKTISELIIDQFYQTLASLAKEKGVMFTAESVAPTMLSDGLQHYKTVDMPMGEFWMNSPTHDKPNDMLDAISGAHIYGKNIVQAEAFTTVRMDWNEHPGRMKTLMDRNFALGINKMVFHVFTHNPWTDQKPGMTLDGVGLYFQRDQTWWKPGKAWIAYTACVQRLLQEGRPVTDVAVFTGEELPRRSVLPDRLVPVLPGIFGKEVVDAESRRLANLGEPQRQIPDGVTHSANMADPEDWVNPLNGYAYDSFNPDVLSTAEVKNGEVVFKSGTRYKLLIVPGKTQLNPNFPYISYQTVKKLMELVKAGAHIMIAEKPVYQTGIKQETKIRFDRLVNEIWGGDFENINQDGQSVFFRRLGSGKIFKTPFSGRNFGLAGVDPDFLAGEKTDDHLTQAKKLGFAHRRSAQKDIYFISNQQNKKRKLSLSFRVEGKIPEAYDAVSDKWISIKNWSIREGRTWFDFELEPNASIFVIFEKYTQQKQGPAGNNQHEFNTVQGFGTDWQVKFDPAYGGPADPVKFSGLSDWTSNANGQIKYYSGTATYVQTFNYEGNLLKSIYLNLGQFSNIASVKINGISCGVLWTPPFRTEVTHALRQGQNQLEIEVTNTWANRLIGDRQLPESKRITKTTAPYRLEGKPLNPAGLMGPVTLQTEK